MKGQIFTRIFFKLTGGVTDVDGVTVPRLSILCFPPFLVLWWAGIYVAHFADYALFKLARGLGFHWFYLESKFKFKTKTIKRPQDFKSRELREAFDEIGARAANLIGPDGQEDGYWFDPVKFWFFRRITTDVREIEARQRVLDFFVSEGILLKRWRLGMGPENSITNPCRKHAPYWDAEGNRLADSGMKPTLLTDEEKAALIGKDYAVEPLFFGSPWEEDFFPPTRKIVTRISENSTRIERVPDPSRPRTKEEEMNRRRNLPKHQVTENDFQAVYYRPSEVVLK